MKSISSLIIGLLVGSILGLWVGVNIGKEQPVLSNPFTERSVHEKLRDTGENLLDSASDAIKKGGDTLRDKLNN